MSIAPTPSRLIADYDSNEYDYREYWTDRDYEQRAERAALRRLIGLFGPANWLVDLGGGYGRNLPHCLAIAEHVVLVDYSRNSLRCAAALYGPELETGRLTLIRADVRWLPFCAGAFDIGIVIRVLHHLPDLGALIDELSRTVSTQVLLDVPIKHHVLAWAQCAASATTRRSWRERLRSPEPAVTGATAHPFTTFQLSKVREDLDDHGWTSDIAASVNNLRRWDQVLPPGAVRMLAPAVHGVEIGLQYLGRGWWGPNQFLLADRYSGPAPILGDSLAQRLTCPLCLQPLYWQLDELTCNTCARSYRRVDGYWDFVC